MFSTEQSLFQGDSMSDPLTVSIVSGTFNRLPFLRLTVENLRREAAGIPHELIVVDGGSADGTVEWLTRQKDIVSIIQHNRGQWRGRELERRSWGGFMNLGFKAARGKYILLVSDDCLLLPGALAAGVKQFEDLLAQGRKTGAVAFYWRDWPSQEKYVVGRTLGDRMFVNHGLFLRRAVAEVGWIDEERYAFYHADGDLALQLWHAGYEVSDCPAAYVEHFPHAFRDNPEQQEQDNARYLERWTGIFYDPAAPKPGGWTERAYADPAQTGRKFQSAHETVAARNPLRHPFRRLAKRLGRSLTNFGISESDECSRK
jgi:GT2 family glycosyltransferase